MPHECVDHPRAFVSRATNAIARRPEDLLSSADPDEPVAWQWRCDAIWEVCNAAPDGFLLYSHAGDDWRSCRDHVRACLGMPAWEPGELHRRKVGMLSNGVAGQVDIDAHQAARNEAQWASFFAGVEQLFTPTEEQRVEMRNGLIDAEIYRRAVAEKDRLVKDKGFYQRLKDHDSAARKQWGILINVLALRPVASPIPRR